jgi:MoxR-like ATPase
MGLHRAARALALLRARDFCLVDDVKELVLPVLAHRVISSAGDFQSVEGRQLSERVLGEITRKVEIPI